MVCRKWKVYGVTIPKGFTSIFIKKNLHVETTRIKHTMRRGTLFRQCEILRFRIENNLDRGEETHSRGSNSCHLCYVRYVYVRMRAYKDQSTKTYNKNVSKESSEQITDFYLF